MNLICNYCNKEYEGILQYREQKNNFCSNNCWRKYSCETRSDQYTPFRYMFKNVKDKKRNIDCSISLDNVLYLWKKQKSKCALTNIELIIGKTQYHKHHGGNTASLDRIDSDIGYHIDNIQIIHKIINNMKGFLPQNIFIYWCHQVAKNNSLSNEEYMEIEELMKDPLKYKDLLNYRKFQLRKEKCDETDVEQSD